MNPLHFLKRAYAAIDAFATRNLTSEEQTAADRVNRNPANPQQTWTGRGRSPLWVQDLQNNGTLESARINSGE
jgi:DNA-binding protein H-NS